MITDFVVMTSSAKMPLSVKSLYRNVAVVEIVRGTTPTRIAANAKGVVRIVEHYGPQFVGKSEHCQYQRTLKEASKLAMQLRNNQAMAEIVEEG